jgi:ABC-2 type transport system permease protein
MSAQGSIYDLGYQGYDGPRLGRVSVAFGLLRQTLREAWGIGRGGRAKIAPFTLAGLTLLPAVLAIGITAIAQQAGAGQVIDEMQIINHASYQSLAATLVTLFVAVQAPELFGRDQRYGVLPLYFSRVLTRLDYALARVGGLFLAILIITLTPHLVLTVGQLLTAVDPITGLTEDAAEIPRYLAITVLTSALFAAVASVIAAWTPRRAYATAGIIAAFIVPSVVALLVAELGVGDLAWVGVLVSPGDIIDGANAAVFGTIPESPAVSAADLPGWTYVVAALVWTAALLAAVLRRYQAISG